MRNGNKEKKPRYLLLKAIAFIGAVFAVLGAASFPLKTVNYTVYTDKISDDGGIRIAQVSDLHGCAYGKDMKTLIDAIDEQSPDIVAMTGDIYDDILDNRNTRTFLKQIAQKYPCYYVAGNHEFYSADWQDNRAEAESFGITVLESENISIGEIMLCGAAASADGSINWVDCVDICAENTEGYSVLLYHFPEKIDYCRAFGRFDLILCGHAHGGQWRIPGLLNGLYAPGEGLFPQYAGGRYDFPDCTMIVSRGLSRVKEKIPRIFNNPELVIIDILPLPSDGSN